MYAEQANWQIKAGGEFDKFKDRVRLVENRITEIQAAALGNFQKVNREIAYLRSSWPPDNQLIVQYPFRYCQRRRSK